MPFIFIEDMVFYDYDMSLLLLERGRALSLLFIDIVGRGFDE